MKSRCRHCRGLHLSDFACKGIHERLLVCVDYEVSSFEHVTKTFDRSHILPEFSVICGPFPADFSRVSLTKGNRFPIVLAKLHKRTTYGFFTASVQRLNFAPGMGCRRRVASAKAFLASLNACSASSVH
ncbi:hypothetical protein TNCV_2124101 [Trichonephila clavipes]|nr:hypothetical protein TNCV_2124101 [Trichonephila clavipes]